eukprot:scpid27070/ scgid21739/ Uncharacterized protein KIAA0090 homolog
MRFHGLIVLLVIWLPVCVFSMHADQAGLYDWRRRFIGAANFARFDQSSHSSRRVVLATQSGVLASINARTGQLGWRQVFAKSDDINALQHRGTVLATLSSGGQLLRGWDVATGSLAWETVASESRRKEDDVTSAILVESKSGKSTAIAVLLGDDLQLYSSKSGQRLWGVSLSESSLKCDFIHATAGQLRAIGVSNDMDLTVITYHATNGDVVSKHTLPAAWISSKPLDCIVLGSSFLVCLDHVTFSLQTAVLELETSTFVATSLSSLGVDMDQAAMDSVSLKSLNLEASTSVGASLPATLQMQFLLSLNPSHKLLLKVDEGSAAVSLVREFSKANVQLYPAFYGDQGHLLMLEHDSQSESLNLEWLDLSSDRLVTELAQKVHLPAHHGAPVDTCIYLFSKKDSTLGYRVLLQTEDHALSLVQQSARLMWTREESLADIVATELVELPISTSEEFFETLHEEFGSAGNVLSAFVQRVTSQLIQAQHWLTSLHGRKQAPAQRHASGEPAATDAEENEHKEDFLRDQFNLHRMIVVATAVGKIFGIDSRDGSVHWQQFPRGLSPFRQDLTSEQQDQYGLTHQESYQLIVLRSVQHFPLEPLAVLFADSKSSECSSAAMLFFNPITGEQQADEPSGLAASVGTSLGWSCLPFKPVTSVVLPVVDASARRVMAILDQDKQVHILPASSAAEKSILALSQSVYLYVSGSQSSVVQGYHLTHSDQAGFTATPAWQVTIPSHEQVMSITGKSQKEVINSLGSVMTNGSVHYKYLNPNLFAMVTESRDSSKPAVSLYLVDGVTGAIVYHGHHKGLSGPVHLVHSDNWLVYSAYHSKLRRSEVNVVELYDGFTQPPTEGFSSMKAPSDVTVLTQSYIFRTVINTLAVSYTRRGVTHRDMLFGLENGGVLSLVKFFMDPRRPLDPTNIQAEGTMPYLPELPYNTLSLINYNQSVTSVRQIHTCPSGLESTSLVFAHGLDLFFTRLSPSKTFDQLPADFDRLFIIGILVLLGTVTFVSSRLSARKALQQSWK